MEAAVTRVAIRQLVQCVATVAALASAAPARAAPEYRIGTGPATACLSGYAFTIAANESFMLIAREQGQAPDVLSINSEALGRTALRRGWDGSNDGMHYSPSNVTLGKGLIAIRRTYPSQMSGRAGIPGEFVFERTRRFHDYLLPEGQFGGPVAVSSRFSTAKEDRAVLARIAPFTGATPCAMPETTTDSRTISDFEMFSANKVAGPATLCRNGMLLTVEAGETAQQRALETGSAIDILLRRGTAQAYVMAKTPKGWKATRGPLLAGGYRFTKMEQASGYSLLPPQDAKPSRYADGETVLYTLGFAEPEVKAMAERLEFVAPNDRRCPKKEMSR